MFNGSDLSWQVVLSLLIPAGLVVFLIAWFLTKLAEKRARFLLRYPTYYGGDEKGQSHRLIPRKEGGKERDPAKEILDWIKSHQSFLILSGEGGIGKTRAVIDVARKRRMRIEWINLKEYRGREETLLKGLEEVIQNRRVYVFEDYQEFRECYGKVLDIIRKKTARLITVTRDPLTPREELKNRGEAPFEIRLGKMENIREMLPIEDPLLLSHIVRISEGIPAIAKMALRQVERTGSIMGMEEPGGFLDSLYHPLEKRNPEILPLLGKMALLRGMEEGWISDGEGKFTKQIQEIMAMGNLQKENGVYRIVPNILNDYIARKIYFEPEMSPELSATINEFLLTKSKEILTTLIQLNKKKGTALLLERAKVLDARTVIDLGMAAYEGFKDIDLVVKNLGNFWNRVWELEDPNPYNAIAILLHRNLGEWEMAEKCWRKALLLYQGIEDEKGMAQSYHNLGIVFLTKGEWEKADEFYRKSLFIREKLGDRRGAGETYNNLGNLYRQKGRLEKALEFYNKSIGIFEKLEDIHGIGQTYCNLGNLHRQLGNFEEAGRYYTKSLEIFEKMGDTYGMARTYGNLGIVYRRKGNWEKAVQLYEKDLSLSERVGDVRGMAQTYNNLGIIYRQKGLFEKALRFYEKSNALSEKLGDPVGMAQTQGNMGILLKKLGRQDEAEEKLLKACEILKRLGDHGEAEIFYQHLQELIEK